MDEEPVMPKASHNVEEPQKTMEMAHEDFIQNVFHSEYPHLTNRMVNDINAMTKDAIEALANDGDNVRFSTWFLSRQKKIWTHLKAES